MLEREGCKIYLMKFKLNKVFFIIKISILFFGFVFLTAPNNSSASIICLDPGLPVVCNPADTDFECGSSCQASDADCAAWIADSCFYYCGDSLCTVPEDTFNCPADCGGGGDVCGDSFCTGSEDTFNCPADCGAPTPNLTATSPSPSTATTGVAQTFSSTITNNGTAGTGASFSNFFQRATAANGGGTITDFTSTTMTALANGASNTATSPSYTFPSAGTYSVRACADKTNAASTGTIAESNEGDNCSAWTNVVVSVAVSVSVNITSPAEGSNSLNSNIPINWTTTGSGLNCLMWFTEGGPQMPYTSCPSGANTTQLSYVHMPTISGRVLAMDFVENAGITTYDRSANGNNGTLVNATWTASGKYGKALNFN